MKSVIELAKQACAPNQTFNSDEEWVKRFAALVRAEREWVDLTDDEIVDLEIEADKNYRRHVVSVRGQTLSPMDDYSWHFARAVIAAFKEKNK